MIVIRCQGLKKQYQEDGNKVMALDGIDLEVSDGKLTMLVGPSGSGKTTLLSILHTILTPDQGDLWILDHHLNTLNKKEKAQFRSQHIGSVFQALHLISTLTVLENVTLPLVIQGEKEELAQKKAIPLLKRLGIEKRLFFPPAHLSRGQQQRVAIARALINDPKVILCDEPTSALDHTAGFEFMTILKDLALQEQRCVFVVTHDHRIFPFADRIVTISDGKLEEGHA